MGHFQDKVVVITGAGGGIGRAHALAFAREGARVVVNDLGVARDGSGDATRAADRVVEEIVAAGGAAVASYDSVSTPEGASALVETALRAFGQIDVLVNNAGILRDKTMLKMTREMFDDVIDVHLRGTWLCTQAAARSMVERGQGRIINTTSVAGLKGNFGQTNYAAAKAGIYGLTLSAALELGRSGVTVNAIAPIAKTRMTDDLAVVPETLKAEQISPVVMFLASDAAADVNGRIFGVHGEHVFEYRMTTTDGQRRAEWTIDALSESLPAISADAPPPAAGSDDAVATVFAKMPTAFVPERAGDWRAVMHFVIAGGGSFTVDVKDGKCTTQPALAGSPSCVVKTDRATFLGMLDGSVDGQQAFMQGKITASNIADMMRYRSAFSRKKSAGEKKPVEAATRATSATPEYKERIFHGAPVVITREHSALYAAATDDDNPLYLDGAQAIVPPMLAVRYHHALAKQMLTAPGLQVDLMRLVFGEQQMRFHAPLRVGDVVSPKGRLEAIEEKESGTLLRYRYRLMREGELVNETVSTYFVRGDRSSTGERSETSALRSPWATSFVVRADQSRDYARASLDDNPIHVDERIAQAAGFPGVINHGLCTLALAARAIVAQYAGGDPRQPVELRGRFSAPVAMGDRLTVRAESSGSEVNFEVQNQTGRIVLRSGMARLHDV